MLKLFKTKSNATKLKPQGKPLILDSQSKIKGDLILNSDVRIDGNLEGNITTSCNVIIGEGGRFTGKIISNNFHLFGYFQGVADVAMRATIHKTGEFHGSMITETIHIESGGILDAPSLQMRNLISQLQPGKVKTESTSPSVNHETVVTNNVRHLRLPEEVEESGLFEIKNSSVSYRINSAF